MLSKDEIDKQLIQIQKSTKPLVPIVIPLHEKLRMRFRWYYNWHLWPGHAFVHYVLLVFIFMCASVYAVSPVFRSEEQQPETLAAATTCYWVGDTNPAVWNDANHWADASGGTAGTCDGGVVPGSDDAVIFDSANTNSVNIDTTVSVISITNTGDYSGTMDGNTNNVNISGNFRWDAGNLDLDTGTWTVNGDWDTSGTTITKGSSTVVLTGTGKNLTSAAGNSGNFQNLTIDGSYTSAVTGSGLYVYGALTVNLGKTLTIDGASSIVDSKTAPASITLNGTIDGTGTLFLENGSIGTGGTINSDVRYGLNNINITSRTYGGDLAIRNSGTTERTATLSAGTLSVAGDFNVLADGAGNTVVNGSDNDPTVSIAGGIDFTGAGAGTESISMGDGNWSVGGNIDLTGGSLTANSSTLTLNAGDTGNTITSVSQHFNNIAFSNAAGGWSFSDETQIDGNFTVTTSESAGDGVNLNNQAVTITGNLQIDAGKLTCGSSTVQFGGNFVHNGGTFVANTSIMKMTGGGKSITANNTTFATLWHGGTDVNSASGTFSVTTLLDLDRTFNFSGTIKMLAGSTADIAISSAFGGGGTVEFYDSAGANLTGAGSIRCDFVKFITENANTTIPVFNYGPGINTVYATNISSNNYNVYLGTGASQSISFTASNFRVQTTGSGNLTLDAATYDPNVTLTGNNLTMLKSSTGVPSIGLGDGNWTISGNVDFTNGTVTPNNSTVIFNASDTDNTITSASQHFNNVQFNNAAGRWAFQDAANINGNLTVTNSEAVGNGVNFNNQAIDIGGSVQIDAGKLTMGNSAVNLYGNWTRNGGTVAYGTSDVILDGLSAQSIISGGQFFNNLTLDNTDTTNGVTFADSATVMGTFTDIISDSKVTFSAGDSYSFNSANIAGTAGHLINLRSSIASVAWLLDINNVSATTDYISVSDSDASSGSQIDATTGGFNGGGNSNWLFAVATVTVAPASATLDQGATQTFTATASDAEGYNVPSATFNWSVVADGGTITPLGVFTAGTTAGTYTNTVRATSSTINGFASVIVNGTPAPPTPEPEPEPEPSATTEDIQPSHTQSTSVSHYIPTQTSGEQIPEENQQTSQTPLPQSDERNIWNDIVIILENVGKSVGNLVRVIGQSSTATLSVISASVIMAVSTSASVAAGALGSQVSLSGLWLAGANMLFAGNTRKVKKSFGVIFDSKENRPISGALVQVINLANKRKVASAITDDKGQYFLTVDRGNYQILVAKAGFSSAGTTEINVIQDDFSLNNIIPLEKISEQKIKRNWPIIILSLIRLLILIGGTIFIVASLIKGASLLSSVLCIIIAVLWLNEFWLFYCRNKIQMS